MGLRSFCEHFNWDTDVAVEMTLATRHRHIYSALFHTNILFVPYLVWYDQLCSSERMENMALRIWFENAHV